ncbi:hypothetical protein DCC85_10370 [Paenibacillus sp. CAA11]|uniref:MTP-1 family protein n=1 Tax=Paenibacillus sp. CAA11 TaxID=1532905 RepID=UPI000D3BEFFC|nr:DUF1861 family protein [Paenibacillus sp. CAA11]AWB46893.1 hypothetical protein DCC85_10370 [Paenibacillus sp. CAA11]
MNSRAVKTCDVLLKEFHVKKVEILRREKLLFSGVGDKDVYNITAPFQVEGHWVLAGRVESRDSEQSEIIFFSKEQGSWTPIPELPTFQLQDPFMTQIGDQILIGGVQTFKAPGSFEGLQWRTVFYKGVSLRDLKPFFEGPDGMKDIRLVKLSDGEIGIFTRPQGAKGGLGKIGFFRVSSLDKLTLEQIAEAPLLEGQFAAEEWGGVNEAHLLSNGWIGVLGHIAHFDSRGHRHYYPMVFALDPVTGHYSDIELIAVRSDFEPGPAKRADLEDVVFSGGIIRKPDGTAELYAGVSDAEAQLIVIPDPFIRYEQEKLRK